MNDYIIQIKNLSKRFCCPKGKLASTDALRNIDLNIPRGCIYGIIGMSGAGKTTLLRCLTGLEIPCEGILEFNGQEFPYHCAQRREILRKQMGMVFQHFQLFSSRTVCENIAYPLEILGIPATQRLQRVKELLALINLESKIHHYPFQLSGGEKQRIGIARALACHPRILLCDEPTSALDPKTTRDLLCLLKQLNQQLGLTVIIITHQLEAVKQVCQRVAVLADGQIIEEGEVKEIFTKPQHPITQHLLHMNANQVPSDLLMRNQEGKCLVRLGFEGKEAKQPVLSQMLKKFDVEANILSGGLDYIQDTIVGHLFVELSGSEDEITRSLGFLGSKNILYKVLS